MKLILILSPEPVPERAGKIMMFKLEFTTRLGTCSSVTHSNTFEFFICAAVV